MRVSVYYINGAVDEFNFETFTNVEPFYSAAGGVNIGTEFCLRTDLLAQEGLRVDINWYNNVVDDNTQSVFVPEAGRNVSVAGRELGRVLYLVSLSELSRISKILVDGEVVVWRQGNDLINAVAFASQEMLCYSDASTKSINLKVTEIFDYLKSANPDLPDEQITQLFGYPYAAYKRILEDEGAQIARRRDGLPTSPEIATQIDFEPYVGENAEEGAPNIPLATLIHEEKGISGLGVLDGVLGTEEETEKKAYNTN